MVEAINVTAADLMRPEFLSIDESRPLSELIGLLKGTKYNNVLVFNGKNYVGMCSLRFLLRRGIDVTKTKIKSVVERTPVISLNDDFYKIAELMFSTDSRLLPVESEGKIVGVVPSQRLIELIKSIEELRVLTAKDIASTNPFTVNEDDSLSFAMNLMKEKRIKKLIVLKNRKISGVLSFDKILAKLLMAKSKKTKSSAKMPIAKHSYEDSSVFDLPVTTFMDQEFALLNSNEPMFDVVSKIRKSRLGVIHSKLKPKGIITTKNLLQAIISTKTEARNIQISGLPKLDEIDFSRVERTISVFYDKAEKIFNQKPLLKIHFKRYQESGLRSKHSIHAMLSVSGITFNANAAGWSLLSTLQEVIRALDRSVTTKIKAQKY